MKKFTFTFISIIILSFQLCVTAFANAHWENPKSIKTYIEPNAKSELMKEAFSKWSTATNNKLTFKYVQNKQDAQIVVVFVKDASKSSKIENAAGVTYHESIGDKMVSAKIEIADNAPNGAAFRKDALLRIMIHEIGHSIGIFTHSTDTMSIMYPIKASRNQAITQADIKAVNKLYGWN
jgi:predicted Zn-dependent protease